jgi:hypothetical protein
LFTHPTIGRLLMRSFRFFPGSLSQGLCAARVFWVAFSLLLAALVGHTAARAEVA